MSTVDLLAPRIKVIADFWDNPFQVGDIIQFITFKNYHDFFTNKVKGKDWSTDFIEVKRTCCDFKQGSFVVWNLREFTPYPHLFQPLEWWEERKVEDMPEYVRHTSVNKIEKVIRWCIKSQLNYVAIKHTTWDLYHLMPATEQEYINTQNK